MSLRDKLHGLRDRLADPEHQGRIDEMLALVAETEAASALAEHQELDRIVAGMTEALREFEGAVAGDDGDRAAGLAAARRRFAIHLGALLEADGPSADEDAPITTAVIQLRSQLQDMGRAVADVIQRAVEATQAQSELELAGVVQHLLVRPTTPDQEVAGVAVASWFSSAGQVAGDWWSLEPLGEGAILVLGDVTGHGAPAALVAATAKGACDLARLGMREQLRPFMLFNMLNRVVHEAVDGEYLMTGIVARYIQGSKQLAVSNAGHRSLWLFREGKLHVVKGSGDPPLGTRRSHKYQEMALQLRTGDRIVVFTDGIPEAENAQEDPFGEKRMREAILVDGDLGSPADICDRVRTAMQAHVGETLVDDDTTLVVLEIR